MAVSVITTDGHTIIEKGMSDNNISNIKDGEIKIGNHCWIGNTVKICKNSRVSDNCICAQNSLIDKNNIVIAGIPARTVRHNVNWKL